MVLFEDIWAWLVAEWQTNDFFTGAVGGAAAVSLLYQCRTVPKYVALWLRFTFTCSMTVHSADDSFLWIAEYLAKTAYAKRSRRMRLANAGRRDDDDREWVVGLDTGLHVFMLMGRPVWVRYTIAENQPAMARELREMIEIRVLGRSRAPIERIVAEAERLKRADDSGVPVYVWSGGWWQRVAKRPWRDPESVIMDRAQRQALMDDVRRFRRAAEWYRARGIPWHRGYLLHGPPGTGKTSLVHALASEFRLPVSVLNIGSVNGDEGLQQAFWQARRDSILLIEDVDAAQARRSSNGAMANGSGPPPTRNMAAQAGAPDEGQPITLSCLLNAIDGFCSTEGRILVMTTNHPEKLDPAIRRPGRIDMEIAFDALPVSLVQEAFSRFYGDRPTQVRLSGGHTGAQVQCAMLKHPHSPESAAAALTGGM